LSSPSTQGQGGGLGNEPEGYFTILQAAPGAHGQAQPAIAGLEEFFIKLVQFWNLTNDQAAALLGYSPQIASKVSRIMGGLAKLETVDERERVLNLFEIRKLLAGLFRSQEMENLWLRTPNAGLGGSSPMTVLLTRTFPSLLRIRQFVEHLAGV